MSRVARMSTIGATMLATAAGLTFGLFLPSVAHADDPPPSTVPTPTVPTPDPAPPKPTQKAPVKKTTLLPKVTAAPPVAAVSVRHAFQTKPGGSFDLGSLLIVLGLGFAIACFTIALVPATYVKWRPAAIFVSERRVDVTVVGLALLVAAACTLFWTKGP